MRRYSSIPSTIAVEADRSSSAAAMVANALRPLGTAHLYFANGEGKQVLPAYWSPAMT